MNKMKKENKIKKKIYSPITIDLNRLLTQKKLNIQGIEIYFPYEPYPPQKIYMEKVIKTLNKEGSISALESPTGTGKTLCLLCAVFAWVMHTNKEISIYYCTRTVSQINNLLKELNKTCYSLNISFIASRKHTCLKFTKSERNKMSNTQLRDKCEYLKDNIFIDYNKKETNEIQEIIKKGHTGEKNKKILPICEYYKTVDNCYNLDIKYQLEDIEDLLTKGKKQQFCPYYYNVFKSKMNANLTIMTYNYLLNPYIRKGLNIIENNSIIILDEAHNICDKLENSDSKTINNKDLEKVQQLLQVILNFINNKDNIYKEDEDIHPLVKKLDINKINEEIKNIKDFIDNIDKLDIGQKRIINNDNYSGKEFYKVDAEFFKKIFKKFQTELYYNISKTYNILNEEEKKEFNTFYYESIEIDGKKNIDSLMKTCHKIYEFLNHLELFEIDKMSVSLPAAPSINDLPNNIKIEEHKAKIKEERIKSFIFVFTKDKKTNVSFEIICIDPSYGLKEYLKIKPYSTILTSGTLSINSMQNLLNIKFTETLNNDHVINKDQFMINIINGYELNKKVYDYSFIFKNKNNMDQIMSLGEEIFNLANSVKIGGILVYFQSFEYLNSCYKIWLDSDIVKKYEKIKDVVFELPFTRDYSQETIMETKKKNNILLFTVYRGINSEGIDFPDDEARMIICVGVPFQNLSDIKVQLKRDFLDQANSKNNNGFDGKEWYREDAMNAVNQALGRLLRNINDYGIMICFGIEFSKNMRYFTKWIRNNNLDVIRLKENNQNYYNKLSLFLINLREKFSKKKIKISDSYENDELDYLEDKDEYNNYKDNNEDDEEKYIFSFSLERSISKIQAPKIGYKRYRDENDDDNY